jgi:hypothetical protein
MSTWHRQIDEAKTVGEVVSITRDFLATITPKELGRLPANCRPGKIRDESDIADLHARLAEEYGTTRASGDELTTLQMITAFMVRSSVRIAELGGDTSVPASTGGKGGRSASGSA